MAILALTVLLALASPALAQPPAETIWIPMTETRLLGATRALRLEATRYRAPRAEGAPLASSARSRTSTP